MLPDQALNLQTRHVPWSGMEPTTFGAQEHAPSNQPTLARANAFSSTQECVMEGAVAEEKKKRKKIF